MYQGLLRGRGVRRVDSDRAQADGHTQPEGRQFDRGVRFVNDGNSRRVETGRAADGYGLSSSASSLVIAFASSASGLLARTVVASCFTSVRASGV